MNDGINRGDFLINFRHELHRHPELSTKEFETTRRLRTILEEAKVELIPVDLPTGVFARIQGAKPGPTIALRSDIDALPILEKSGVPYVSENPGVMHACGHDFHMAVILGATLSLNERKADLAGTLIVLFQPAEETGVGAKSVLESGVLENVSAIFGFHNDPSLPVGALGTKAGALTAAVDRFAIQIHGAGAHGAKPNEGKDPLLVVAQIIQDFQTIVSRNLAPDAHAVVSITQIHGGNTWNVIPEEAMLEGTVRTFSRADRAFIETRIRAILAGLAIANDVTIDLDWFGNCPSVFNDEKWTALALEVSKEMGYDTRVVKETAIGEDFAYYQEAIPGCFVMIGSGGPYELHDPRFRLDDQALLPAVDYFVRFIEKIGAESQR
jgi:amidohydrolase